jgi:hypothetical protein
MMEERQETLYANLKHSYFLNVNSNEVIDATQRGNESRFLNHSCDPNAESQKWHVGREVRVGFFSLRDIKAGEEIVFDYDFQRIGRKRQRCYCGAANCRGVIEPAARKTKAKTEEELESERQKKREEKMRLAKQTEELHYKEACAYASKWVSASGASSRLVRQLVPFLGRDNPRQLFLRRNIEKGIERLRKEEEEAMAKFQEERQTELQNFGLDHAELQKQKRRMELMMKLASKSKKQCN